MLGYNQCRKSQRLATEYSSKSAGRIDARDAERFAGKVRDWCIFMWHLCSLRSIADGTELTVT